MAARLRPEALAPARAASLSCALPGVAGPGHTPPEKTGEGQPGRKFRILVVDDSPDAAESLAIMLRLMGQDIQTAHDGVEAVQAAATFRPEVVLLDIGMPKMNGYESAQHIRQQPWGKGMALVAVTGWGQEDDKKRAIEAGFDLHLTKPIEPVALEKLLAEFTPHS